MYPLKHSFFNNTPNKTPDLTQSTILLRVGISGLPDEWDPSVSDNYNILAKYYRSNSLESVIWQSENSTELKTNLATSWEIEYWPEQMNTAGFNNTGGVKSITFTLRENVQFHDGSDWNATVMKWNIDRINIIAGNYSGKCQNTPDNNAEGNLMHTIDLEGIKDFFTQSWNMSQYDAPNLGTSPPSTPPKETDYAWYDLGPNASLVDYSGVDNILPNNTIRNPNPYGGWDVVSGSAIHYAPYDRYPIVNYVEILENPQSGGKIKVHFNHWTTSGLDGGVDYPMISYHSYKHDYTTRGIYGYENGVSDPRNAGLVTHMIGTGPYIYVEHDQTGTPPGGYMLKNENYWNKTALEIDGWFDVDRLEFINFPSGSLGEDAQSTAMLTHAIDFAYDSLYMALDYDAIIANPNIDYIENGVDDYLSQITLNCINETWWAWPWADSFRMGFYPLAGNKPSGGVPRAMRKAMSYAFNYDLYIDVIMNGRVVRTGILGTGNIYHNTTTPLPEYNITKAREILLTTETDPILFNISTPVPHTPNPLYSAGSPFGDHNSVSLNPDNYNFSKMCADRGLTESSTDQDWQYVADNNPIYVCNFYWDSAHEDVKNVFLTSLRNIGCTLKDKTGATNRVTTIIWDTIRIGHLTTFDGTYGIFSSNAWVMDHYIPASNPEENIMWACQDPDKGLWRTLGLSGITSWHYWGNYGFNFDAELDHWVDRIWFSNRTEKMKWLNKIAEKVQNEIYPNIYISQAKKGLALWDNWEITLIRGDKFFANFQKVPVPPGDFELSSDAGFPDDDGIFNLMWDASLGADNYSIYRYGSKITQINGSLDVVADQVATSPFPISGLTNGKYYFVVVAYNHQGNRLSNNIDITVQTAMSPPGSFVLSTDADFPDSDGIFNLSWTSSIGADNYSLYMDDTQITVIDSSLTLVLDQTATTPFPVLGLPNGEYYFVVVAHNQYGDKLSNNVHITINISGSPTDPEIPGYNAIILTLIAICTTIILFKKRKKKFR